MTAPFIVTDFLCRLLSVGKAMRCSRSLLCLWVSVCVPTVSAADADVEVVTLLAQAETGNAASMVRLGNFFLNSDSGAPNLQMGFLWVKRAAEAGDPDAQDMLGRLYLEGRGVRVNVAESFEWTKRAANGGSCLGQLHLGSRYEVGIGVDRSVHEAERWYEKSAERGCVDAQYTLANFYATTRSHKPDMIKARKWLARAAAKGHSLAQSDLGWVMQHGHGGDRDVSGAIALYEAAAEENEPSALLRLALIHEAGIHAKANEKLAADYALRAAKLGLREAQALVGVYFGKGFGVPQNGREAIRWFASAAAQQHMDSYVNLGLHYWRGLGVPSDRQLAKVFFSKAAQAGDATAQEYLKELEKEAR